MTTLRALLPRGRALVCLDLGLILWVVVWIAMGGAVAGQVRGLRQLSAAGWRPGRQSGRQIDAAGASTIASGRSSRDSIYNLSWMLWVFLAVIPTVPVLVLYLPLRVSAACERRALQRLVDERGEDPVFSACWPRGRC